MKRSRAVFVATVTTAATDAEETTSLKCKVILFVTGSEIMDGTLALNM